MSIEFKRHTAVVVESDIQISGLLDNALNAIMNVVLVDPVSIFGIWEEMYSGERAKVGTTLEMTLKQIRSRNPDVILLNDDFFDEGDISLPKIEGLQGRDIAAQFTTEERQRTIWTSTKPTETQSDLLMKFGIHYSFAFKDRLDFDSSFSASLIFTINQILGTRFDY